MDWQARWDDPVAPYLQHFHSLIGDRRIWTTFAETVKGIIAAGSLVCHRIAAHSPILASGQHGAQRIIRMLMGDSTTRSPHLTAEHLSAKLRQHAVAHLGITSSDELWLIADGSELRKPHARVMPHLMRVKDLDGGLVNGYRTLNGLGITPQWRGVLYHRLFSSKASGFVSESHEIQQALTTVSQAIAPLKARLVATWIVDSGFDDVAVWRTIWEQGEHVMMYTRNRIRNGADLR